MNEVTKVRKELAPTTSFKICRFFNGEFEDNPTKKVDKELLVEKIKKVNATKQELEYVKALLNLEVSIFEDDNKNYDLIGNPYFMDVAMYHLSADMMSLIINRADDRINLNDTVLLHDDKNEWQKIITFGNIAIAPLVELILTKKTPELTIYDSEGFTEKKKQFYLNRIMSQGRGTERDFWLEEIKTKKEATKDIAALLLKHWDIRNFQKVNEKEYIKHLSFIDVKKQYID